MKVSPVNGTSSSVASAAERLVSGLLPCPEAAPAWKAAPWIGPLPP
jgi:hypothetical protein